MTHQDIDILAQRAVRMRFDDLLDGAAGIECLRHCSCAREQQSQLSGSGSCLPAVG